VRARRCRDANTRADDGFTLIEILIAVWILGAVMVALMGAIFTMTRGADYVRTRALAESELERFAEAVRTAPYVQCAGFATTGNLYGNYDSVYAGTTVVQPQITGITYWNPPTGGNVASTLYTSAVALHNNFSSTTFDYCDSTTVTDDAGAQKVDLKVTVTSPGGSSTIAKTTIVKRNNATT
jgi:prepilin-type N-terminal cleavage/methylation domain-containing protein